MRLRVRSSVARGRCSRAGLGRRRDAPLQRCVPESAMSRLFCCDRGLCTVRTRNWWCSAKFERRLPESWGDIDLRAMWGYVPATARLRYPVLFRLLLA
jgi:hypothetical protein